MLFYGNSSNVVGDIVYNISSMNENYFRLATLQPPNNIGYLTDRDFDIAYANYILQNDIPFYQFFMIIYPLYMGKDVYLISGDENWNENLIESILKLIQQRYGYEGFQITSQEDYLFLSSRTSDFDPGYGLINLDQDKNRFFNLDIIMRERFGTSSGFWSYSNDGEL
jgi:hypothetical protein